MIKTIRIKKTSEELKKQYIIPYVGDMDKNACYALEYNYALFTQCKNEKVPNKLYCVSCLLHVNDEGNPPYGTIQDRQKHGLCDYVDANGRKSLPLYKVLTKLKLNKKEVENECMKRGIIIPSEHWKEQNTKKRKRSRGRPKVDVEMINENQVIRDETEMLESACKKKSEKKTEQESEPWPKERFVKKVFIDDKLYLQEIGKSILFDPDTECVVGFWNETDSCIDYIYSSKDTHIHIEE